MKNTKIKVLVITLAVCLLAIGSLGTLAWFTAEDEVTNKFLIADSEDDADEIFSIDVWEDATPEDTSDEEKLDKIEYKDIQPGDDRYKEVNIENTGYYAQYVRAIVTVTGASVWQEVYGETFFALGNIATDLNPDFVVDRTVYDADADSITYTLYYNNVLESEKIVTLFTKVEISEDLDQEQAAKLVENKFNINVTAQAVQTENVGNNAIEAFTTVEWYEPAGFYIIASTGDSLNAALKADGEAYIYANVASIEIDYPVKDKTVDFNGTDTAIEFTANATAENLTFKGIKDADGIGNDIYAPAGFAGTVTVIDSSFVSGKKHGASSVRPIGGNFKFSNCNFSGNNGAGDYALSNSGATYGDLEFDNCTFENFGSWAILVNSTLNGNVVINKCVFNTPDGVFKTLAGGVTGDFTFTDNVMIGVKGHDANPDKILVSGSKSDPVKAGGTKTVTGNTLDGADWAQ